MLKTPFKKCTSFFFLFFFLCHEIIKRTIQCRLLNLSNVIIITYEGKNCVFDNDVDYLTLNRWVQILDSSLYDNRIVYKNTAARVFHWEKSAHVLLLLK